MNRPMRRKTTDTEKGRLARAALRLVAVGLAALLALAYGEAALAARAHFAFSVIAGTMRTSADEAATQRLLQAIGLEEDIAFVVYDGNLKGPSERCADSLYAQRQQILATSRVPLVVVPGQYDWAECGSANGGGYDAAERLDFLRQTIYADNVSLGQSPIVLKRESDVARFHSYRENVRWQLDDTVFVSLNVVGGNNHYLSGGGRNGEYDDRAIASAFWLEHAAEYARRRNAHALVVFVEADPDFARYEHAERFSWLRMGRTRKRDGYLEFKRSLVKAAETYRGPVVVIHDDTAALSRGFTIDQPLFDDKGSRMTNVTRIAIAPRERTRQWVRVDVNFDRTPPFQVTVRRIPAQMREMPAMPPRIASPSVAPGASELLPTPPAALPAVPEAPASEPPLLPQPPAWPQAGSASGSIDRKIPPPEAPAAPTRSGPGSVQGGS